MNTLTLLLALVACAGCALLPASLQKTIQAEEAKLVTFTTADLQQAIGMANAATDPGAPYRARCYGTLLKHVSEITPGTGPQVIGVVSGFEKSAELDAKLAGGATTLVPADVHADCAGLVTGVQEFLLRLGLKLHP